MLRLRSIRAAAPALAGLALLASACGQAATGGSASAEVRLVTTEWKFDRPTLQVPAGRPVVFVLDNKGLVEHDVTVMPLGFQLHAQPGQTTKSTFTFDRPGTYELECSLPGHKDAGMKGTLIVAGP
jgi:uncharacterized cupredoxin-like copper-binding protein